MRMLQIAGAVLVAGLSMNAMAVVQTIDTKASKVLWVGKKVTGQHNGWLKLKEGTVDVEGAAIKSGTFTLDMASIDNEDLKDNKEYYNKLVGHLKSDDFFNIAKWPTGKFVLTSATPIKGKKDEYTIKGDLTIRDKTNAVEFPATVAAEGKAWRAKGSFKIDRTKWDIKYNSKSFFDPKKLGDKLIYDDIELSLDLVTTTTPGKA